MFVFLFCIVVSVSYFLHVVLHPYFSVSFGISVRQERYVCCLILQPPRNRDLCATTAVTVIMQSKPSCLPVSSVALRNHTETD